MALAIEYRSINDLIPYVNNSRTHSEEQVKFAVTPCGKVYSLPRKVRSKNGSFRLTKLKELTQYEDKYGYMLVTCKGLGIKSNDQYRVHRLVMLAAHGDSELEVNHKNGNKKDNRVENLEYCTSKENSIHAVNTGLIATGSSHHNSKPIEVIKDGFGYVVYGCKQIKSIGLRAQSVHRVARNERKSIHGWSCEYV